MSLKELSNLIKINDRIDNRIEYMFNQWFTALDGKNNYSETITKLIIRELTFIKTGEMIPHTDCAKPMIDFQRIVEGMTR